MSEERRNGPETCWHFKGGRWEQGPPPARWVYAGGEADAGSPWEGFVRAIQLGEPIGPLSVAVFEESSGKAERWIFEVSTPGRWYIVAAEGLPDFLELLGRLTGTIDAARRCEWDVDAGMRRSEWDASTR
jgi:hypothetical protein